MEAAAETIRELRAILPERPHQLAKSPDWAVNELPQDPSFREEYRVIQLGYMTFSSEADRGIVFTRSYDDIRPKPMPREVNLARSGHTKTISINDYKKKKVNTSSPDQTLSTSTPKKVDSAPVTPLSDARKQDRLKPPPADIGGSKLGKSSTLTLKPPPTLPPKPPTPDDSKKRRAPDDGPRAQKRQRESDVEPVREERPREGRAKDDRSREDKVRDDRARDDRTKDNRLKDERGKTSRAKDDQAREEPPRTKPQDPTVQRDTSTPKEKERERDRSGRDASSTLPNGRSILKATTSSRSVSPTRARGNSINGITNGSGAAKDPQKPRSAVPRLLSPLELPGEHNERIEADANRRPEKKRRIAEVTTTAAEPQASSKRSQIPQLLSPTLPSPVEAELQRLKRATQKDSQAAPKVRSKMIVTIKIPKSLRQQYRLMMKITSQPRSSTLGIAQRAEKRPSGESVSEAMKRPRASSTTSSKAPAPPPPSTPSKAKGAPAMSRVSSSNSVANTPGDANITAATPNVPDSGDRASHRSAELREKDHARIQLLKDKESEFQKLGRVLKHKSDALLGIKADKNVPNGTRSGTSQRPQSDIKSGWAHLVESLLCFVVSFHCADIQRDLLNKMPKDHKSWQSLGPLANVLDGDLRKNRSQRDTPMLALKIIVQLIANDQVLAAYATQGEPNPEVISRIMRCARARTGLLAQLRKANDAIEHSSLIVTMAPWSLEDTVADMLRVTRRWCADEGVKWSPVLNLKDSGLKD